MRVSGFPQNTQIHLANDKNPVSEQHKTRVRATFLFTSISFRCYGHNASDLRHHKRAVTPNLGCIGRQAFTPSGLKRWSDQSEYPSQGVRRKSPNGPPSQTTQTTAKPTKPPTKPPQTTAKRDRWFGPSVCRTDAPFFGVCVSG